MKGDMPGPAQDAPISPVCVAEDHEECDGFVNMGASAPVHYKPCGCDCHTDKRGDELALWIAKDIERLVTQPGGPFRALHRKGVTFTPEQLEYLRSRIEEGEIADAQKLILDEIAWQRQPEDPALMSPLRAAAPPDFDRRRLNYTAFPFVPDTETGDAPDAPWFTGHWEWEAYAIQARHGTLLPPEEIRMVKGTVWVNGVDYDYLYPENTTPEQLPVIEAAVRNLALEMRGQHATQADTTRPRHLQLLPRADSEDRGGTGAEDQEQRDGPEPPAAS